MLTKREFELLNSLIQMCCNIRAFPFAWDSARSERKVLNPHVEFWLYQIPFNFLGFSAFLYLLFVVIQFATYAEAVGSIHKYIYFHLLHVVIHVIYLNFYIGVLWRESELRHFLNQLETFNKHSGIQHMGTQYSEHPIREKLVKMFIGAVFSCSFFILLAIPFTNDSAFFFSSVLPPTLQNFWIYAVCAIFDGFMVIRTVTVFLFVVVLTTLYLLSTNFWLQTLRVETDTSTGVSKLDENLNMYRELRILNTLFNQVCSELWIPTLMSCIIALTIMEFYGNIRLWKILEPEIFVILPINTVVDSMVVLIAPLVMSKIYEYSSELGKVWIVRLNDSILDSRNEHKVKSMEHKYFQKKILMCSPLHCQMSGFFLVEKETGLIFIGFVIEWGIFFLLSI